MPGILRKWVHSGGVSRVSYSPDGSTLYTTGGDVFLRVFSGDPKDNNEEAIGNVDYHDAPVLSMDCSMESLVTGCEDGQVGLFQHGSNDFTGLVTRSALGSAIRCVKFSPNGQRVAVASDELIAKIVDVRDTSKMQVLEGHTKGIRALTWSPDGLLVTTSGSDGTIRVWDVSNPAEQEPTCIKVLDGLIVAELPKEDGSDSQCEAIWHPGGKYFVVGTKSHEIAVISRETWEREGAYEKDGHAGELTTLTFSPNGRYLCSSARDSSILVWDTSSRTPIIRESSEALIACLAWRPGAGSNSISFIDNNGYVSRWDDVINSSLPHPNDAPQAGSRSTTNGGETSSRSKATNGNEERKKDKKRPAIFFDEAEMEGEGHEDDHDDEDDLDLELGGGLDGADPMDEDDFIEDDEDDAAYQSRRPRGGDDMGLPPPLSKSERSGGITVASSSSGSSLVRGQEPFQPGATPLKEKRRYLAFNMLGVIHIVERESHNIVTIDFHDQSSHPSHHFDDYSKFSMGALGSQGTVYASTSTKASGNSVVSFKPFESWNQTSGDWSIDLPIGETVTALAIGGGSGSASEGDYALTGDKLDEIAGSGTVVVATSRRFLRFLAASGTQKYVMNFGDEIVAMTAGREWLVIVHRPHDLIKPGHQELSYTILDLDTYELIQRGSLPLLKGSTLSWIGFSQDQMPYMFDSNGMLSALERSRRPGQARWIPMLDTLTMARREGKVESYWPVGVNEASFMCLILKGEEKFPYFPTPITQDLPIQIPLLDPTDPKTEIEHTLLRTSLLASHARDCLPSSSSTSFSSESYELKTRISSYDVEMDKSILKLVQMACKTERQQQALDLARTLFTSAGLGGAIKIANLYSLSGLVGRLENLKDAREGFYGASSWREKDANKKREGKYGHLVDNRVVPDSVHQLATVEQQQRAGGGINGNLLSMPFDNKKARPKAMAKNVFSAIPEQQKKKRALEPTPTPTQASEYNMNDEDMEDEEAEGSGSRLGLAGSGGMPLFGDDEGTGSMPPPLERREISEEPTQAAPKPRMNPFAKSARPAKATPAPSAASTSSSAATAAGPSNPFAKKPHQSNGLKKTDSFFSRVDASNGTPNGSTSASATTTTAPNGPKQSTLFGLPAPPKPIVEKKGKGKKRKSEATANGDEAGEGDEESIQVASVRKAPKTLGNFFGSKPTETESVGSKKKKAANSSGADEAASEEETQIITDEPTTMEEDDAEPSAMEADIPSMDETNNSTESIDAIDPITPALDMEEEEPVVRNDGMSKLAAFRFAGGAGGAAGKGKIAIPEEEEEAIGSGGEDVE